MMAADPGHQGGDASTVVSGIHHGATCGCLSQSATSGRSCSVIGRSDSMRLL
ncbi:hypothetical protein [Trebonia kvetii]|uniref:hypothetical protein n=1 Tax=Trebonia kvetii TaxID=2480626 RepID=UPI0016521391|nr:hypothetical protein [Trebonia kvetii]